MNLRAVIILLLALLCFSYAWADTIYLKNGRSLEGIIKAQNEDYIELEVNGGVVKFQKNDIIRVAESMDAERGQLREKWKRDIADTEKRLDEQKRMEEAMPKQVEFVRGNQGMVINALINGRVNAKLVLDTGASAVVLRRGLADQLDLGPMENKPDLKIILADGSSSVAKYVVLRSVKIDNSEAENVDAAILPDDSQEHLLGDGLLGMSFLKHFDFKVNQKENKLILEKLQ